MTEEFNKCASCGTRFKRKHTCEKTGRVIEIVKYDGGKVISTYPKEPTP